MRTISFASPLLLSVCLVGCGSGVSTESGAAACIVASACGLFGAGSASTCTQTISDVNDPSLLILTSIEAGGFGGVIHISPAQVNCIAGAGTDCNKARACLDGNMTPAACTGNSSSCMGSIIVSCSAETGTGGNNGQSMFDCATLGPGYTCVASNGNVDCGTATCGGGNPTQCSGNVLQGCHGGILDQVDCTKFSATCVTAGIEAHCRGTGPACQNNNGGGTVRCDGSTLVVCADGQEARYNCGNLGLTCTANPDGSAGFSCNADNKCDPGKFTSICQNNVLTYCNKGKIDTFNCSGAGFSGCDAQNGTCTK